MHVKEVDIFGMTMLVPTPDDCPKCGKQMENAVMLGEFCEDCVMPRIRETLNCNKKDV